jgi:hypothetical protein
MKHCSGRFGIFAGGAGAWLLAVLPLHAQLQGVWTELTPPGTPALAHHSITYDSARHRALVVGQENWTDVVVYAVTAEGVWTKLPAPVPQPQGDDLEIAYDADRDVAVLYTTAGNKVWELGADGWELKEAETTPVQCSDGALLQYDPARRKTVLVGAAGWPEAGKPSETWLWDGEDWTRAAGPDASPPGAAGGVMAFDAARAEMVLVTHTTMETWTFDGATWTRREPATVPEPGVWVAGMAYYPPLQCCVLYGGEHIPPDQPDPVPGYPTRAWAWNGDDWTLVNSSGGAPANIDFGFIWFPELEALVMHGGWGPDSDWKPRKAVWALTLTGGPPPGDLRFTQIRWVDADTLELVTTGGGGPGRTQTLQATTGLGAAATWTDLESRPNPSAENTWRVKGSPAEKPRRFFRVIETP